jgi:hypothetical protein
MPPEVKGADWLLQYDARDGFDLRQASLETIEPIGRSPDVKKVRGWSSLLRVIRSPGSPSGVGGVSDKHRLPWKIGGNRFQALLGH